jgi:methanogenic corrinoid protein MtbC1
VLPEAHLESLAREAIRRLAAKAKPDQTKQDETHGWDVDRLCHALIGKDGDSADRVVQDLLSADVAPEDVYLDYLAVAARRLGTWWIEDKVSFWEVTVGTCRLLAIMRSMRGLFDAKAGRSGKTAIFATVPGEQHTVGITMAADLFRKDGWDVTLVVGLDHDALVEKIERSGASVIALSMSGAKGLNELSRLIVSLHVSKPDTPIVLNGNCIKKLRPKLAWMDLAGTASDIDEAKEIMTRLVQEAKAS